MVNLPVSTALADYTGAARNGDVVKSREAFAIFTETSVGGGYWSGSLQYLKPGEGYMLYRNGDEDAQFRYPFYEPGSNFFEHTAQNRAPMCYGWNMSVVATVEGIDVQEGDRLLAFADGAALLPDHCGRQEGATQLCHRARRHAGGCHGRGDAL
jgi:hypothetical protein